MDTVNVPTQEAFDILKAAVVANEERLAKVEALIETLKDTVDTLHALLHPA